MEQIKKQNITSALREYCDRYESQTRASLTMRGVSPATITQMLNGKWEKISDEMWRNVAAQIDYKDERWEAVETMLFKRLTAILTDAQENALVMAVCGDAGSGKTFASKHYAKLNRQVFMLCCNEYWNRKDFLQELLQAMGRDFTGASVSEMMRECVRALKVMEHPLLILDEADKLSDSVLYFFITLYNQLEDECGIVLCATNHLEKKLSRGIKLNRKGYTEIWSRIGRKCIPLRGVSAKDIAKVCEANGVCDHRDIDGIIEDSDCDLRRVKRKVHATIKAKGNSCNNE
jgi:DNA transposition AAA+ family ATPase